MKFIDDIELSKLAQSLTHEGAECSVRTRIEAYSCKNIKRDKKLFKSLEEQYNDEVSNSPPVPSFLNFEREATTFGPFEKHASRKTLYLLIATLNVAFPDHRFADVRPAHFNREKTGASVLNSLSTTLVGGIIAPRTYSSYPPTSADFFPSSVPTSSSPLETWKPSPYAPPQMLSGTHPSLYRVLDERIGLAECEVYSYVPDIDSDPHAGGFDSDDDDTGSIGSAEDSSDPDEYSATFEFDDYDVDEVPSGSSPPKYSPRSSFTSPSTSPAALHHHRRRGALLWSSHWFFLNRKLNRILFITVWARTRGTAGIWDDDEVASSDKGSSSERFFAWEGGEGAGARAMGI